MTKSFLIHYIKTKPETNEQKYLFLVDTQDMAYAIISAGYPAVTITEGQEACHSAESFSEYMNEIAYTGTYQTDYVYVPACSAKKVNDSLEQCCRDLGLTFRRGWTLFNEKEYLAKSEQLLIDTNKSVTDIAIECGFSTTSYFILKFRRKNNAWAGFSFKNQICRGYRKENIC